MASTYDNGLGYGHFGEPSYIKKERNWAWQRPLDLNFHIEAVGPPEAVVPPPSCNSTRNDDVPDWKTNELASPWSDAPELVPSRSLLPDMVKLSSEIVQATELHDPITGNLLAIGTIRDNLKNEKVVVVVFVSDQSKRQLCVMRMQLQRQGWGNDKHDFVQVPQIGGEQGFWESPSSILQVVFHKDDPYHDGHIAVRTSHGTYLLRIKLDHQSVIRTTDAPTTRFKFSVRSFSPACNQNGTLHSDVSINPWMPTQLAVIDVSGRWQVCESTKYSEVNHARIMTQIAVGCIGDDGDDLSNPQLRSKYDGWARISWIQDHHTLLACNRTKISLVDLPSGASCDLVLDQMRKFSDFWILDLQIDPSHPDRFFVLTKTSLYHVLLVYNAIEGKKYQLEVTVRVLSKIRHFRDHLDPSLRVSLTSHGAGTIALILSSASQISSFTFYNNIADSTTQSATVSLSYTIPSPWPATMSGVTSVLIQPAKWPEFLRSTNGAPYFEEYRQRGINFWTAIRFHQDMSISQQLLAVHSSDVLKYHKVLPLQWRSRAKYSSKQVGGAKFIVEDEEVDAEEADNETLAVTEMTLIHKKRRPYKRSLNLEDVYQSLLNRSSNPNDDLTNLLILCEDTIRSNEDQRASCKLIIDFTPPSLQVSDLQEAINGFDTLLQCLGPSLSNTNAEATINPISDVELLHIDLAGPNPQHLALESVYNGIISSWLSPLTEVPGRIRLAREQLCRRVAAQLCLASYTIRPAQLADVPNMPHQPLSSSHIPDFQSYSSQSSAARPGPTINTTQASISAAIGRLSLLTPHAIGTASSILSTAAETILSHWSLSGSPEEYDWSSTRSYLRAELEHNASMSQLSDRERVRRERRAAKARARREKEDYRARMESSQAAATPGLLAQSNHGASIELTLRSARLGDPQPLSQGFPVASQQPVATPHARPPASSQLFPPFPQTPSFTPGPNAGPSSQVKSAGPVKKKAKLRRRTEGF